MIFGIFLCFVMSSAFAQDQSLEIQMQNARDKAAEFSNLLTLAQESSDLKAFTQASNTARVALNMTDKVMEKAKLRMAEDIIQQATNLSIEICQNLETLKSGIDTIIQTSSDSKEVMKFEHLKRKVESTMIGCGPPSGETGFDENQKNKYKITKTPPHDTSDTGILVESERPVSPIK